VSPEPGISGAGTSIMSGFFYITKIWRSKRAHAHVGHGDKPADIASRRSDPQSPSERSSTSTCRICHPAVPRGDQQSPRRAGPGHGGMSTRPGAGSQARGAVGVGPSGSTRLPSRSSLTKLVGLLRSRTTGSPRVFPSTARGCCSSRKSPGGHSSSSRRTYTSPKYVTRPFRRSWLAASS
jgi:hypothetical protein